MAVLNAAVARARRLTIHKPKNAWVGLFYLVTGLLFAGVARTYALGSARSMGAGYFPFALGCILAGLGLLLIGTSLSLHPERRPAAPQAAPRVRTPAWPFLLVTGSLALFAATIDTLGLFLSVVLLILVSSRADPAFSWWRAGVAALVVATGACLLFVVALGLQMPVWPQGLS